MTGKQIRCAILGGGESDLYVLGELHKRRDVEIAFVYDRNPAAVALEIAEILRLPRLSDPADIPSTWRELSYTLTPIREVR